MGFYVSGVDAPKNCRECGHDLAAIANCVYTKRLVLPEEHDMSSGRHPLCPISPVETPHGRMVDVDATDIYRREERAYVDIEDSPFSEYLEGVKDGLHEAAKCLSTAHTIIPAERGG